MPDPDVYKKPLPRYGSAEQAADSAALWFHSEEWGQMRHKHQVAPMGVYTNPITGKEFSGAPMGRPGNINIEKNTGVEVFSYIQEGPADEPWRVITDYGDGRPSRIQWASGRVDEIVGDFDLTRPGATAEAGPHWSPGDDLDDPDFGTQRQDNFWISNKEYDPMEIELGPLLEGYVSSLETAVDASDPSFLEWHKRTNELLTALPDELVESFMARLQAFNESAWTDLIHETIYPPGNKPSETTTTTTTPTTPTAPPPTTTTAPPPTTTQPTPVTTWPPPETTTTTSLTPDPPVEPGRGRHRRPHRPQGPGDTERRTWPGGGLSRLLGEDIPHEAPWGNFQDPKERGAWERAGWGPVIEAMEGLLTALRDGDPVSGGPGPTSRGDVGGRAGTRDAAGAADEGPVNVLEAMRRHPAFGSPGR